MTPILAVLIAVQAQGWQAAVDSLARNREFSGVVLVARGGVPQFERAYGMCDREAGKANTVETAFNLGSINKFFTGIAIRQLAAAGKLDIDSSLARAWPDYPNQDVARRVTIRQILLPRSEWDASSARPLPPDLRNIIVA
jgi:CubicO group peptidase (beta-lactamase class C family)